MGIYANFNSFKPLCFFVLVLAGGALAQQFQNPLCPFDYLIHLGDGYFDTGNSVRMLPYGPYLPPTRLPYGETYPGRPAGRWCDGKLDPDLIAGDLGFEGVVPYLGGFFPPGYAVMFAVARSPVLDRSFFLARNIRIPAFAAPLTVQMSWLRKYLYTVASTREEIADVLSNTLFFFGDTESSDLTYGLLQGKSFEEVKSYIPYVVEAQVNAAREVVRLGGTRILFPGGFPIGCYPYILTQLASDDPADYDELGCLKTVNDLVRAKDDALQRAIGGLQDEFPNNWFQFPDFFALLTRVINESASSGVNTLQACCGEGGAYNFNSSRFCGSPGVPVCSDPSQYLFWDGLFLTNEGNSRAVSLLRPLTQTVFNCTAAPNSLNINKPRLTEFDLSLIRSPYHKPHITKSDSSVIKSA